MHSIRLGQDVCIYKVTMGTMDLQLGYFSIYIPDGFSFRNTNVNQSVVGGFISSGQSAGAYGFDVLDKPSGHWWQVSQIYIPDGFLYDNTKRFHLITGGDANDSRVGFMFCRLSSVSGNYGWAIELYFLADTIQFNNSTSSYILIGGSIWDNSGGGIESCALINVSSANSPYIEPVHTRWYYLGHTCWPIVYSDLWYV